LLSHEAIHVVWCDLLQEIDVVVGMELGHLASSRRFRALQIVSMIFETQ
jgi:hypothetical protein